MKERLRLSACEGYLSHMFAHVYHRKHIFDMQGVSDQTITIALVVDNVRKISLVM